MKYKVNLDSNSLYALADELNKYADEFQIKVQTFLTRLADVGIRVAQANGGIYGAYIVYSKDMVSTDKENVTLNLVAQGETLVSEWYPSATSKEVRTEAINTLLMAEFGSGHYAIDGVDGLGGQGTLNVYGHANDKSWGWWADTMSKDGELKAVKKGRYLFVSDGLAPAQPLHKAVMACIEQVTAIAQEVFG